MIATPIILSTVTLPDIKSQALRNKTIIAVIREAQDIYKLPSQEIQKAAITHLVKHHFFQVLPKTFDSMVKKFKTEMLENESFDAESYRKSRILYDAAKPFINEIGEIKIPSAILNNEESRLYKSLLDFLYTIKDYLEYLDKKFVELDKPKFKSNLFAHIPESKLWNARNKNRPYIL